MTLDFLFKIDPVTALVNLEKKSFLYAPVEESSLLRRILDKDKNPLKLDLFFHSKNIDAYFKKKQTTQVPEFLYVARKGLKFNGHSLAAKVLSSGNIFLGEPEEIFKLNRDISASHEWFKSIVHHPFFIGVNSSEATLELLISKASQIKDHMFKICAVTGTNGKTSLVQNLSWSFETLAKKKTLKIGSLGIELNGETYEGSHSTTPDYPAFISSLIKAKNLNIKDVFIEASSHGLKERRMGNFRFDLAIFTNLTQDHLDYHVTLEDYMASKRVLFNKHLKKNAVSVINTLRDKHESFLDAALKNSKTTYLITDKNSEYLSLKNDKIILLTIIESQCTLKGSTCKFTIHKEKSKACYEFFLPQIGMHQIENALCLIAALHSQGFEITRILDTVAHLPTIPGRLEEVTTDNALQSQPRVYVDFAHSPDAVESILTSLKHLKPKNSRLISVMGCGGDRDSSKRAIIGKILEKLSDMTFVTSDNPRNEDPLKIIHDMMSSVTKMSHFSINADRKDAIKNAIMEATHEDIVLILGKGHENYQIIKDKKFEFSDAKIAKHFLETLRQ